MAYIKGFTLQWVKGMAIMKESGTAQKWAEQAVAMGPNNARAHYVLANHDYHTPAFAGGGKKAKKLFTKALELYKQSPPNPMLPSWGMPDTYAGLVRVYIKEKDAEMAAQLLKEGLEKFPTHHDLLRLKKKGD